MSESHLHKVAGLMDLKYYFEEHLRKTASGESCKKDIIVLLYFNKQNSCPWFVIFRTNFLKNDKEKCIFWQAK